MRESTIDQLYSTTKAGELLGGLHANDVRHLIRTGKLHGKAQVVRGKKGRPRLYVAASEIARYIRELPDANDPPPPAAETKPRAKTTPRGLAREIAAATQYL